MFTKRRISLFFSMISTSISLLAGQIATYEKLDAIVKLFALPSVYSPFVIEALPLTTDIMFLIVSIGIESYIAHRMIKKPYVFILPRMIVTHLLVMFFDMMLFSTLFAMVMLVEIFLRGSFGFFWSWISDTISVICILFIVRFCYFVIASTSVFSWYAPSVDRRQLRKAMLYATTLNYLIVLAILLFTEHSYLIRIRH